MDNSLMFTLLEKALAQETVTGGPMVGWMGAAGHMTAPQGACPAGARCRTRRAARCRQVCPVMKASGQRASICFVHRERLRQRGRPG